MTKIRDVMSMFLQKKKFFFFFWEILIIKFHETNENIKLVPICVENEVTYLSFLVWHRSLPQAFSDLGT